MIEIPQRLNHLVWMSSSGSIRPKWVGLSREALESSAHAVNQHLLSDSKDRWLNVLPLHHVGGLGTKIRAELSGADWHDRSQMKWQPRAFVDGVEEVEATLTSLVPTQVFDLVEHQFAAPKSLRCVVVGGGRLAENLFERAQDLGWPLLTSFGMTEVASQIATSTFASRELQLLSHIEARTDEDGILFVRSPALCSAIALQVHGHWNFMELSSGQWFQTEDRVRLDGRFLTPIGRVGDRVKVLGELVDVRALDDVISLLLQELRLKPDAAHLISRPHPRSGSELVLVGCNVSEDSLNEVRSRFNQRVHPYERATRVAVITSWPKSDLGKIQFSKLEV